MKTYNGNVEITSEDKKEWEEKLCGVERISGYCSIYANASLPALKAIGGHCSIYANASLPALKAIGGYCSIYANASLRADALEAIGGDCYIYAGGSLIADALEAIGGYCYISAGGSLRADTLKAIGGDCHIYAGGSLRADTLKAIGGNCSISANASLPALKAIGGYCAISAGGSLKADTKNNTGIAPVQKVMSDLGYLFADGILTRKVSKRKSGRVTVHKTRSPTSDKLIYVAQRGELYSHGDTVKQAVHDLRYKLADRDTTKYKGWKVESVHSVADIIGAYRAITGACETGVKSWCEGKKLPEKLSVRVAIQLTRGAYGAEKFKGFFKEAA